ETAQGHVELGDGAPVELGGGDDVVAGPGERREGDELGAHPGRGRDRADPTLERGDALVERGDRGIADAGVDVAVLLQREQGPGDRKSTRLNSSHVSTSYAVFCLKKKTDEIVLY